MEGLGVYTYKTVNSEGRTVLVNCHCHPHRGAASGQLTRSMLERRNDYLQARARYGTMMEWERDELIKSMGELLAQCERDVQERMVWHLLLVHDDYGNRVGGMIGVGA